MPTMSSMFDLDINVGIHVQIDKGKLCGKFQVELPNSNVPDVF